MRKRGQQQQKEGRPPYLEREDFDWLGEALRFMAEQGTAATRPELKKLVLDAHRYRLVVRGMNPDSGVLPSKTTLYRVCVELSLKTIDNPRVQTQRRADVSEHVKRTH